MPGDQVPSGPGVPFSTSTSSLDRLAGLCVRWTLATARSNLPTLDVDNELDTGVQARLKFVKLKNIKKRATRPQIEPGVRARVRVAPALPRVNLRGLRS